MDLCRHLNFRTLVVAKLVGEKRSMGRVFAKHFNLLAVRRRMAVAFGCFLCGHQMIWKCSMGDSLPP